MGKKKPTIQMVADLAGVSRGTVDRVLKNRPHVREEVYEKVTAALKETGYIAPRDSYQQILYRANYETLKLGVLLPNWTGHFRWEIEKGIQAAAAELSEFQVEITEKICETDTPAEAAALLSEMKENGIRGISVCAISEPEVTAEISSLISDGIPVITYNSDIPKSGRLCFIGQDYNQSGRIAADVMSKCISRQAHILAAVGNREFLGHRERLNGFLRKMEEIGYPKESIRTIETFNDYQITVRKITDCLRADPEISAVYMANRSVSGCIKAIENAERKGSVHVVCHDMSEQTKMFLKNGDIDFSISQDLYRQGYLPLIYLREYIQKNKPIPASDTASGIALLCSENL